jgi:hypothetical protein
MPEDRSRTATSLDRALDAALADLTSTAPPRDLRGRVLARLSAQGARPRRSGWPVRWTVALPAAAAMVAMILGGVWFTHRPGARTARETPPSVAAVAPAPVATPPAAEPPASPVARVAPRVARAARHGRPSSEPRRPVAPTGWVPAGGDEASGLPLLEPPASLRAADLATVDMPEPSPIEVPSLRIEPLADVEDGGLGLP